MQDCLFFFPVNTTQIRYINVSSGLYFENSLESNHFSHALCWPTGRSSLRMPLPAWQNSLPGSTCFLPCSDTVAIAASANLLFHSSEAFLLPWVSGQGATPQTHQKLISKDLGFSCHLYLGLALSCPCLSRIQYQLYRRSSVNTCSTGEAWGILLGWGPLEIIYFLIHQHSIQQLLRYCVKHWKCSHARGANTLTLRLWMFQGDKH